MTRWARAGDSNRRKPLDASKWEEMKKDVSDSDTKNKNETNSSSSKLDMKSNKIESKLSAGRGSKEKKWKTPLKHSGIKNKFGNKDGQWSDEKERHLAKVYNKETKREHRRVKRIQQKKSEKVCYNCRQPGHKMQDCELLREATDQGTGICFKCGSTEHSASHCSLKLSPGEYPFAKCFICGEMGHITRQCPDNPRGLYPKGGCCRACGAVDHYMKDCPQHLEEQGISSQTVERIAEDQSVDAEYEEKKETTEKTKKNRTKVIKF